MTYEPTYRYYALECDACKKIVGMNTDGQLPSRGLTICVDCWMSPGDLPEHLRSTLRYDQAGKL
ncbi:hypothetical protein SEA_THREERNGTARJAY_157 [Mycobacterium phage ThreeRngTarjay]|nr:hypothetical protein SEA_THREERNGTARJAY_157 [Mycobacterium phage ThreeRngTarjay]